MDGIDRSLAGEDIQGVLRPRRHNRGPGRGPQFVTTMAYRREVTPQRVSSTIVGVSVRPSTERASTARPRVCRRPAASSRPRAVTDRIESCRVSAAAVM
jgi:hypothetical protein